MSKNSVQFNDLAQLHNAIRNVKAKQREPMKLNVIGRIASREGYKVGQLVTFGRKKVVITTIDKAGNIYNGTRLINPILTREDRNVWSAQFN